MRSSTARSLSFLAATTLTACGSTTHPSPARQPAKRAPTVDVAPVAPAALGARRGACRDGDAAACEELFARYLLGEGVERSAGRARGYQQRAWELRLSGCTRGHEADCRHLPGKATPMPLTLAPAAPSSAGEPTPVDAIRRIVTVDASGAVAVDGNDVPDLDIDLPRYCHDGEEAVVAADRSVAYREVVDLLDALKHAGCTRISFAVAAP